MNKEKIGLLVRTFFGAMSMTMIYYGVYKVMTGLKFNMLWLILFSSITLYFIGVSCGWLDLGNGVILGVLIKVLNYILLAVFVYNYLNNELTQEELGYIFLLLGCTLVISLIAVYVSVFTCMYGMAIIINSEINKILKVVLCITQYIAILDLIVLIIFSLYLHINTKEERREIGYAD